MHPKLASAASGVLFKKGIMRMKRIIAVIAAAVCLLVAAGCTPGIDRGAPVIDTNNISRILCFGLPDARDGLAVTPEDMEEMTAWLATFVYGGKVKGPLPPGTNSYWITVEYHDGRSITTGIDAADVEGVSYYIERDPLPDCFLGVFDTGE